MKAKTAQTYILTGLVVLLAIALAGTAVWATRQRDQANQLRRQAGNTTNHSQTDVNAALDEHGITPLTPDQASNNEQTANQLAFLIEEEKLAHDVYQTLYAKWNARTFNNIMESETMHQGMVLAVMQSRNLPDPRKAAVGEFTDQELQKLYNTLIAQGNQSLQEAYNVGVLIEQKDIADIKDIAGGLNPKDTDIKNVLDNLMQGSENHLRAFSRQAGR